MPMPSMTHMTNLAYAEESLGPISAKSTCLSKVKPCRQGALCGYSWADQVRSSSTPADKFKPLGIHLRIGKEVAATAAWTLPPTRSGARMT